MSLVRQSCQDRVLKERETKEICRFMKKFLDALEDFSTDFRNPSIPDGAFAKIYDLASKMTGDETLSWENQVMNSQSESDSDSDLEFGQ